MNLSGMQFFITDDHLPPYCCLYAWHLQNFNRFAKDDKKVANVRKKCFLWSICWKLTIAIWSTLGQQGIALNKLLLNFGRIKPSRLMSINNLECCPIVFRYCIFVTIIAFIQIWSTSFYHLIKEAGSSDFLVFCKYAENHSDQLNFWCIKEARSVFNYLFCLTVIRAKNSQNLNFYNL